MASSSHERVGSSPPASSASGPVSFKLGEPGLPATDLEVIVGNVDFELALCVSDSDWVELDCGLGNMPSDCSLGDITWGCRVTEIVPGGCGGGLSNSLAGSLAWNSVFLSPKPWHS